MNELTVKVYEVEEDLTEHLVASFWLECDAKFFCHSLAGTYKAIDKEKKFIIREESK